MLDEAGQLYDSRSDTLAHIGEVRQRLGLVIKNLVRRQAEHDLSKLVDPEKSTFDEFTPKLKNSTYGSKEYEGFRKAMGAALEHHYSVCDHHPEHFGEVGIRGMNLLQLTEMLCDWVAACMRHSDGNIRRSIEINQRRFGYSDELKCILLNTLCVFEGKTNDGSHTTEIRDGGVSTGEVDLE